MLVNGGRIDKSREGRFLVTDWKAMLILSASYLQSPSQVLVASALRELSSPPWPISCLVCFHQRLGLLALRFATSDL